MNDSTPVVRQRVKITGKVAPASMPVWLERWQDGAWIKASDTVTADARGHYLLRYSPDSAGTRWAVHSHGPDDDGRVR